MTRCEILLAAFLLALVACEQSSPNYAGEEPTPCVSLFDCQRGEVCLDSGVCGEPVEDPDPICIDNDNDGAGDGCAFGADCDDNDPFRNPLIQEICSGVDDDCDFLIDEGGVCDDCVNECVPGVRECASDTSWRECRTQNGCNRWLPLNQCDSACANGACVEECDDFDGDGFGEACPAGPDCDDRNPFSYPGNAETCDGYDNNCNGAVDENGVCEEPCPPPCTEDARRCQGNAFQVCATDFRGCLDWSTAIPCRGDTACRVGFCEEVVVCVDRDADSFGQGCNAGPDCNDNDISIRPGASEVCDGLDNNCDGLIDNTNGCNWCAVNRRDTAAAAPALPPGQTGAGYTCGRQIELWSLGLLTANTPVMVVAQRPNGGAPMQVSLHRTAQLIDVGTPFTATGGGMTAIVPADGVYFLRVRGEDSASEPYVIGWSPTSAPCGDDFEPNNSPSTPANALFPGQVIRGGLCPGDLDFYRLPSARPGQVVAVDLASGVAGGRALLELWNNSTAITPDQARPQGAVHTHSRLVLPGDTVVGVRGINPQVTGPYLLSVSLVDAPCNNDPIEPNDRIGSGNTIGPTTNGIICAGELDFFSLGQLQAGSMVDIQVDFSRGNLDAYLFRDNLAGLLQIAITDTAPERLPTRIPQSGLYHVLVMGRTPGDAGSYTIRR